MAHTGKRIRKLSTAVFRGSRLEYNFDVYPITTAITDHPVVFILSRRRVDKKGRAHHAVSCVGETSSIVSEIKKHKRAKCVKGNGANVVCILKEADKTTRSGVLQDISTAREFSCVQGKFKPNNKAKIDVVKNAGIAKILAFKPLKKAGGDSVDAANDKRVTNVRKTNKTSIAKAKPTTGEKPRLGAGSVKKGRTPQGGKRVQSGVDSDGRQRRLSDKKGTRGRTAKTRIAGGTGSRTKLAA